MIMLYQNPPPPYLSNWKDAPVPGWFANPAVSGPRRLAVGAVTAARKRPLVATYIGGQQPVDQRSGETAGGGEFPWIYLAAGAAVLAAVGAYGYTKGWF